VDLFRERLLDHLDAQLVIAFGYSSSGFPTL
jgi:hypothetical protein